MSEPATPAELVVVVDDDYAMRLSCRQILAKVGYRVETFDDGAQGLAAVARERPGLVVVDLKMPGLPGLEVIRRIHDLDPQIVVVVITGYATVDTAIEAMKAGAYDFLPKPFAPDQLRMIVARGLERRRLQQEAHRLEVERELLARRFVAFVSHQLKSPLAAVHQYLDVLLHLGDGIGDEARTWMQRCLARTDEMRRLVDDWLTLARVEGGNLASRREAVDMAPLLAHLLEVHRDEAAARQVAVELQVPEPDACIVAGDPTCVGVLFDNLLSNAVKYNRQGGSVGVLACVASGEVVVEVSDTGEGIPEEALPMLFDEYFRVARQGRRQVGGHGLGLPICRRIATELGGRIEVESTLGVGSVFRVRLPAWRPLAADDAGATEDDRERPELAVEATR